MPTPLRWDSGSTPPVELHDPTFEWVGDSLRLAGTVVHTFLRRIARGDSGVPNLAAIRSALGHAGVSPVEIASIAERVQGALERTVSSERGAWILTAHVQAQCEYAIAGVLDSDIVRGVVDRTFVDADGTRWIIDHKTSAHEGGDLQGFLDDQQRRYQDQLKRYARLLAPLGQPIRLGLYFPLLDEWREWAP